MRPRDDENMHPAAAAAMARATPFPRARVIVESNPDSPPDPTFDLRRRQANLCEAVMLRVIELETAGNAMLEAAKKLRAAVVANT